MRPVFRLSVNTNSHAEYQVATSHAHCGCTAHPVRHPLVRTAIRTRSRPARFNNGYDAHLSRTHARVRGRAAPHHLHAAVELPPAVPLSRLQALHESDLDRSPPHHVGGH